MQVSTRTTPTRGTLRDGELVEQALTGNQRAFETLVERYQVPLSRFVFHYFHDQDQVSDIMQQVLLQLYLSLPTLHTGSTLKPWLFQVARNRCLDELRRRPVMHFSQLETESDEGEYCLSFDLLDPTPLADELAEQQELRHYLCHAIARLPSKFRTIVWLRYTTSMSFSEIGRTLKIPEATAKTYFQRAKVILRRMLIGVND